MAVYKQRSFTGGELAPSLYFRVDTVKYATGLRTCRNAIVQPHGGVRNRTGTKFVGEVKDSSSTVKLIPFEFNSSQTYILEFGDSYMRVIRNGAYVLDTAVNITGITAANPGVVTATSHGLSNGDEVYISGVVGMTEVNGKNYRVANKTTNTFELTDLNDANVDTSGFTAYSSGGTVEPIYEITTPYAEADLATIQFIQSADIITLVHPSYAPRELARTGHASWSISTITFAPDIAAPANLSATGGSGGSSDYVVTAVADESFEESLASTNDTASAPSTSNTVSLSWDAVSGAQEYNVYRKQNGVYGFIGVAGTNAFTDDGITPDTTDTPPTARNPFNGSDDYPSTVAYAQQRLSFANTNNDPEKTWLSRTGQFKNFTVSSPLQDDDAVTFTLAGRQVNSVQHLLDIGQLAIFTTGGVWIAAGDAAGVIKPTDINLSQNSYTGSASLRPLVIENTAIYLQARGSKVRDLGYNLQVDRYSGNDLTVFSNHLFEGYTIDDWTHVSNPNSIVWAVRSDGTLLGLTYLKEQEVSGWHRHDFDGGTVEAVASIASGNEDQVYVVVKRTVDGNTKRYVEYFSSRNYSSIKDAIFMDSSLSYDGRNTSATTMTLSGGTDWDYEETLTLTASTGYFESSDVGKEIHLYYEATNGAGEAVTKVIRMSIDSYTSATVVEGKPDKTVPASLQATATTDWAKAIKTVSGLDHLEGKSLSVLGDGYVVASPYNDEYPTETVSSGSVTLDKAYAVIHAGLPYFSDVETLDIDAGQGESIADFKKNISQVNIYVEDTRGIFAGAKAPVDDDTDALDGLTEFKARNAEGYDQPVSLQTGLIDINIRAEWNSNGRVFMRQIDPLPMTILGVLPDGQIPLDGGG